MRRGATRKKGHAHERGFHALRRAGACGGCRHLGLATNGLRPLPVLSLLTRLLLAASLTLTGILGPLARLLLTAALLAAALVALRVLLVVLVLIGH